MPIVIFYYPLTLCGTGFAKDGKFNPIVLIWGPNLIIGAVGVVLFWRLSKN
jgi:lipopolysaccharide export LptBFGC system permease protein LptF